MNEQAASAGKEGIYMDARKKILIVDDEQINLEFFDVMLSKLGFSVEKAENGVEALEQVKKFNPDLIILDNIMPRMSGWEVTKALKSSEEYREHKDIPVIMFSAMDDVKDKVEGFELGVDDYITKPYNFSEVLARIKAVLRNRELFSQIATRESRIAVAERLNEETAALASLLDADLDAIAKKAEAEQSRSGIAELAKEARSRLRLLEAKIAAAAEESEKLKKKEIEIQVLEKQYRKGLQQE